MDNSLQSGTKSNPDILVLADDLTGALEAGAAFAQRGMESAVMLVKAEWNGKPVLVIDTETRHLSEAEAAGRVQQLAVSANARLVYKKTDSTLRGNIRAELHALSLLGEVLYVPAYPQLGRTLHDGCLHVHGVPVEQTPFATDPLRPVRNGNIAALLAGTSNIRVCEENTEEGIEAAAREWIEAGGIAAGPSSLLHAAAKLLRPQGLQVRFPAVGRALVVSGSRHDTSRQQIAAAFEALTKCGWDFLLPPSEHQGDSLAFAARFGLEAIRTFPVRSL